MWKGKGGKRSHPSSSCPCDRLPGLQIPAWDPHPCSPHLACGEEGRQQRKGPHPARTARTGCTRPATAGLPDTHASSEAFPPAAAVTRGGPARAHTHTHPDPAHTAATRSRHTRRAHLQGATVHRVGRRSDARASVWAWAPVRRGRDPKRPKYPRGSRLPDGGEGHWERRDFRPGPAPPSPPGSGKPPGRPNRARWRPLRSALRGLRAWRPGAPGWVVAPPLPGSTSRRHPPGAAAWKGPSCTAARGPGKPGQSPAAAACPACPARHPNPATRGGCFLL